MSLQGLNQVKKMLLVFILIGILTAVWRASGTIPMIIYGAAHLIVPSLFILFTFLLNALISILTGTSFGTAATLGVICMSIGQMMGASPVLVGGAVLSGIYFGDRCSPLSTSALLISVLTKTDIYQNCKQMMQTSFIPLLITCIIYIFLGLSNTPTVHTLHLLDIIPQYFHFHWLVLLPAILIILLAFFKVKVLYLMSLSIIANLLVCLFIQHIKPGNLIHIIVSGYRIDDSRLASILNGGGVLSMIKVAAIVCISSSYAGIFHGTDILKGLKKSVAKSSKRISLFGSTFLTSLFSSMVVCNQTLTIMITHNLTQELYLKKEDLALALEDTCVVVAPLIPWSIASAVPLAIISAPTACIAFACYLYLIPLWRLVCKKRYPCPR